MSSHDTVRPRELSPFEELAHATDERLAKIEGVIASDNSSVRELLHSMKRLELMVEEAVKLMSGEREERVGLARRVQHLELRLNNGGR